MPRRTHILLLVISVLMVAQLTATQSISADWDGCHDELDNTRKAAADASDAAEEAHSKLTDFEDCKQDPDTYDLMHDNCRSLLADYESATSDAENALDDLDTRLRSVQDTCGFEFTLNKLSASEAAQKRLDSANRRLCTSYKRFIPTLSAANVLAMCKQSQSEEWCKACLGLP